MSLVMGVRALVMVGCGAAETRSESRTSQTFVTHAACWALTGQQGFKNG
jgi:hypothetical protein